MSTISSISSLSVGDESGRRLLVALALGAARTLPLAWLVPALGGPRAASGVRVGVGLTLAVLALPALLPAVAAPALAALAPAGWLLLVARELLVGATVGLAAAVFFRAAEAAGRLADVLRGATPGDAPSEIHPSPLGDLYLFLAVAIFLELGGLRLFAVALARSYEAIPVSAAPALLDLRAAATLITAATAKLVESAVGLAAPVLVAMVLGDVVLGIVGRAAPGIPIHFVSMPAKAMLGLGVVLLGLGAVAAALAAGVPAWGVLLGRAFALWRRS